MADPKDDLTRRLATNPLLSAPPQHEHPTWPGVLQEHGAGLRWVIGATVDWRIKYEALADWAGHLAADRRAPAEMRKDAKRLQGLVAQYLALATPAPGLALQILRGKAAVKHIEAMDRIGREMERLDVRLDLDPANTPVYVDVQTVRSEYAERMLDRQWQSAQAGAAEAKETRADDAS